MRQQSKPIVRKGARLSVRQTLALAIALTAASTMLGAAGLLGYQHHHADRQAETLRVLAMAEVYAAQVAGFIGPAEAQERDKAGETPARSSGEQPSPSELQMLVGQLAWHPGSRLLAVLDLDGIAVAVRGDRSILEQWIGPAGKLDFLASGSDNRSPAGRISEFKPQVSILPGSREQCLPDVAVAAMPILPSGSAQALGTLVFAARTSTPDSEGLNSGFWKYAGAVLAISGAGILMGLCLLWHSLVAPLNALLQLGRSGERQAPLSAGKSDEIDALARLLQDMTCGLDHWRERVADLEASVDRRVQDETQKVTLQLRQVEQKVWMDPLTKLGNRRLMDEKFPQVFNRCRDAGEELAVVMIDVDHFKTLNDTLGHKAGDELIGFIGELLRQCIRGEDFAIRYGGDEFLLILPGTNSTQAALAAERIIKLFGQRARLLSVEPKPSMSAGVASLRDHRPPTAAALLQMADQALYRAKSLGKSQVSVCRAGARPSERAKLH